MFPLGFLFGLGFDTATEVALLAYRRDGGIEGRLRLVGTGFSGAVYRRDVAGGFHGRHPDAWSLRLGVSNPLRKLFYNLTVTAVSVVVALLIGGIETLGLIGDQYSMAGRFWNYIRALNGNFGTLGYLIIGLFVLTWFISMVVYRVKGYDRIVIGAPASN